MAHEHESGLPFAYDRAAAHPEWQGLVFHGRRPLIQGAELTELQTVARARQARLGRLIAKDGDRVKGASAIVDAEAGTVTLTEGEIYVAGDVLPVAAAVLEDVAMEGRVTIGVRLVKSWITGEDDPSLYGLVPGADSELEPGAAREIATIAWAIEGDDGEGQYHPVYLLQDGTILDQTPPPALDGIMQGLALYDRPHGNYIVKGCAVTALGASAGAQLFSIAQGEANINGFKVTRFASLRHAEEEDWDTGAAPGETHTYPGGASHTFEVDQFPIDEISSILLTKEKTVAVNRGAIANGLDGLPDTSVIELIAVEQGETSYDIGADCIRTGNSVDWAPAGAEPAGGSTYNVTYRYRASVEADAFDDRHITVSGGADEGDIIVAYTWKLPRIDRLCIDAAGQPVYLRGVSAAANPWPPVPPGQLLVLADIRNDWMGTPVVTNSRVKSVDYETLWRFLDMLEDHSRLLQLERIKSGIDARDPTSHRDMFVDPLADDSLRDAGEAQTGAVGNGMLQLPIAVTVHFGALAGPVMLDHEEEVLVEQELKTHCIKINPYQNFTPLPGALKLSPASDFWTSYQTEWASPATLEFNRGVAAAGSPLETSSTSVELAAQRRVAAQFLRQIEVSFTISGFGGGEILETLTFDGIDVTPAGEVAADEAGTITDTFTIPANVPAGTKSVRAEGAGGTIASALFTGAGTILIDTMRRVTTVERWSAPPVVAMGGDGWLPSWAGSTNGGPDGGGLNAIGFDQADPQAQIFNVPEPRQLVGVDFHLCALGEPTNAILIHQVGVDNSIPVHDPMAEAFVPMADAAVGWIEARYNFPVTTPPSRQHAFVVKTDDADHSISAASLGGFDADQQKWVTAHPYPVGPRASSVNAIQWNFHQDEALAFRLVAARYPVTTKVVDLGEVDLVDASDLQVLAAVDLPSAECSVVFEIERSNGTIWRLLPGQVLQLAEYITETVQFRAVLKGTAKLSPVLFAPVELLAGEIAEEFTYVSRAIALGEDVDLAAYFYAYLPGGASLAVEYDAADDDWHEMALAETDDLAFPRWTDRKYSAEGITAVEGRLKITGTGGPAARLIVGNLGAAKK
jgi:hypothetical protein